MDHLYFNIEIKNRNGVVIKSTVCEVVDKILIRNNNTNEHAYIAVLPDQSIITLEMFQIKTLSNKYRFEEAEFEYNESTKIQL